MTRLAWVLASALLLAACGGSAGDADGGGVDGAAVTDCAGQPDGTGCGEGRVCMDEACVGLGGCGDGSVDEGEECDDGNTVAFDGCEPVTCTFTCSADADCADTNSCNGEEGCDATAHVCIFGSLPAPGTPCTSAMVADGVCRGTDRDAVCVPAGCGNGVIDGSEDCDDMNDAPGDGCEADCTFSCASDADCADELFCNGAETCDTTSHTCLEGALPDCGDGDDCTADQCDDSMGGCINPLIDEDGDGHAPTSAGACGDDCDDTNPVIYTGAEELCDGFDNNCNTDIDEVAPTWYVDCDADGFAASTDGSRVSCAAPAGSATGCGGAWVTRRPVDASTTDCNDSNANMYPGQTTYFTSAHSSGSSDDARYGSYNCNGTADYELTRTALGAGTTPPACSVRVTTSFGSYRAYCSGSSGWLTDSTPGCGFTGTYTACGSPVECVPRTSGDCLGYTLVCLGPTRIGDPCYCPRGSCTPSCSPGSSRCPWHYYRCDRTTTSGERLGCR